MNRGRVTVPLLFHSVPLSLLNLYYSIWVLFFAASILFLWHIDK